MNKKLIYLASPYSCDPDPSYKDREIEIAQEIQDRRYDALVSCAANLFQVGDMVFAPVIHQRPIANELKIGHDYKTHCEFNLLMIEKCERFMVLKLDGWETSIGVQAEIKFAESIGREIEFFEV